MTGINSILDSVEERNSELEDNSEEITQNAAQKDREMQTIKKQIRDNGGPVRKSQCDESSRGKE